MTSNASYFYLNHLNQWPGFALPPPITNTAEGALTLDRIDDATFAPQGVFMGGPFGDFAEPGPCFRLQIYADPLPENTYVQIFTATSDEEPAFDADSEQPFADPVWHRAPLNELDILIPNAAAQPLWIGGVLRSEGQYAPVLQQMRVDFGRESYLDFLPSLYTEDKDQRELLNAFLLLHKSILGGLEETIADLPRLFDPFATTDEEYPSWLSWLAGWLAFERSETWDEAQTREYLAGAFQLYGWRGTIEGLRRYLKWYAGVEAHIVEPGLYTHLWTLGETSSLGFTTMLAPAQPQGAVVGTTASLDQSHLGQQDRFGAALFDDLAHRFCVQVYCAELTHPNALHDVETVLEREKPTHTDYHLCVIEPRMRVGVQARIGIDAIVGQSPPAARTGMMLGTGILSAAAEPCTTTPLPPPDGLPLCVDEEEN